MFEKKIVTNNLLYEIALKNGINRIHIINKAGKKVFTSHPNSDHKPLSVEFVKTQLKPIFSNKVDTLIVGFKNVEKKRELDTL